MRRARIALGSRPGPPWGPVWASLAGLVLGGCASCGDDRGGEGAESAAAPAIVVSGESPLASAAPSAVAPGTSEEVPAAEGAPPVTLEGVSRPMVPAAADRPRLEVRLQLARVEVVILDRVARPKDVCLL